MQKLGPDLVLKYSESAGVMVELGQKTLEFLSHV